MALDKLARISPAGIHSRPTDWDAYTPSRERRRQQRPRSHSERLLAMATPGRDPESLDVAYHFDAAGSLLEVVITDRSSGRQVAVLGPGELAQFSAMGTTGVLVERKG